VLGDIVALKPKQDTARLVIPESLVEGTDGMCRQVVKEIPKPLDLGK
jgi:hypothetical protein